METMTPKKPRWSEFITRLEGKDGCNFSKDKDGKIRWDCKGGRDKSFAIKILQSMGNIDIANSLKYFEENGGYCDCEIYFNIAL